MNTGIVNDALRLCLNIFNSIPPTDNWVVVNIAKTDKATFSYPTITEIPSSFGYSYDAVPKFLRDEGVIEAWNKSSWFTSIAGKTQETMNDEITLVGRKKGYWGSSEGAYFYRKWRREYVDEGPNLAGLSAVLINKPALIKFYKKYSPAPEVANNPTFDKATGELSFLGEKVKIDGEINIKTMNLLIKNINSRLEFKELYEVRQNTDYESLIAQKGKTPINEAVEKVFISLKKSVEENPAMKSVLVFVQKEGFGIFVDQKARQLLTTPQKAPQKEA